MASPNQRVDHVVGILRRVRPCTGCVAALIRGRRKIAGLGKRNRLRLPVMAGDAEAVQHQYQRSARIAGDRDVEFHPRRCPHDARLDRRGQAAVLRHMRDAELDDAVGRRGDEVDAFHLHAATHRANQSGDDAHQDGLAGAVGADHRDASPAIPRPCKRIEPAVAAQRARQHVGQDLSMVNRSELRPRH